MIRSSKILDLSGFFKIYQKFSNLKTRNINTINFLKFFQFFSKKLLTSVNSCVTMRHNLLKKGEKIMNTKRLTKVVSLVLALVMCTAVLTACPDPYEWIDDGKNYTYNTYTAVSPSNWNELTYQDNNDTQIMSYISSSFFSYDFKFDENGDPIPGEFDMKYAAATGLEDVTAQYADAWGLDATKTGFAWKITLREDLKWDTGEPIDAHDFIYTMKEQLNPLFINYRADSYYAGSVNLVGAKDYAKQGQSGTFPASDIYALSDYTTDLDSTLKFSIGPAAEEGGPVSYLRAFFYDWAGMPETYPLDKTAAFASANCGGADPATLVAMEGKTLAEIKADPTMKAAWEKILGWWQTEPGEELHLCLADYTFPTVSWDEVGIFVGDTNYEIVIVLTNALPLLKEDGTLSYQAAYNLGSLPLVHKETYEACKKAPQEGSTLWTSNYCSNVDTTRSWGPYKLTFFQAGKQYVLERNLNWYGYHMEENEGLYETDKIVCDTVEEWQSAWTLFLAGKIDSIGIDVSIAADYKNSDQAYFTPDDYVGSLQLQSNVTKLAERSEEDGKSHMLLAYSDFRKALSLSINRSDYVNQCTTSSLAGFGLYNSMHYYDVENGGVFRNTDEAKRVLCNVYGVNVDDYASLDEAVDAITGYNVPLAQELVEKAYAQAVEEGVADANTVFTISFGSGADNEAVRRHFNYLTEAWTKMFVGTALEGRVEFTFEDHGTTWANDFRNGAYDVCMGGWTGATWDPGYFLLAYLDPGYMYSAAWNTSAQLMTFTMKGVGPNGEDIEETMSLMDWYKCLNGATDAAYDWSSNALEESQRLQLIAALEEQVLLAYYTVPTYNNFGASLMSYKCDYITYEYNTFMGYGGIKYMHYNFTDEDWAKEVEKVGGELNYK